ncbi:lactosylceramide 1,3-N-acetyl-beta-D-glucosaminyltransferase-like [Daphnia carinata]|uniref:lactosylceramide 1,3-N-acetyl-beta-D-glucosaminyltransferase-like n=1 Tax=Daphnia carinata TaxID=120202 RepID=UPI0025801148|nr:lactosylceramide 1,3-N-acetyl-beta-D-glucosaminyltransferase-like [Daphnia carinata]
MSTAIQFRKGFILFCCIVVSYITIAVYKRDVAQGFCDILVRSNSHAQSIDHFKEALAKSQQKWTSNENTVIVGREFFQYLASQLRETAYPGVDNYTQYVVTRLQLKPLRDVEPIRPDFGPVFNDVRSFNYPIEIRPCRTDNVHGLRRLFVAVISAPNYFEKRDIIRQTWLRQLQIDSGLSVNLAGFGFVIGRTDDRDTQHKIESESSTYGDILQMDMVDVYYNQTLKVVGLLNWINHHCSKIDFFLKVDDDVYINTRNLATVMKNLDPAEPSVYGTASDSIVRRDGKFEISLEVWPWSKYPIYSMGAAILMAGSAMEPLLAACQTTPYFLFDDAYLIGLCTSKAGIAVRVSDRFLAGYADQLPEPCYVHDSITWLTDSVEHSNKSHWACAEFYKNVTPCVIEGLDGANQTADPTKEIEFYFARSQP